MRVKINDSKALLHNINDSISKKWLTNCFLPSDIITYKTTQGKFSKQEFEGGFYLYCNEDSYENLYYFIDKEIAPTATCYSSLPIVLPLVHMEGKQIIPTELSWQNIGFTPYLVRKRLFLLSNDIQYEQDNISLSNIEYIDEIHSMMNESFEPFSSALLSKNELEAEILDGNIFVFLHENKLLGFLHFKTEKNVSTLWHIIVKGEARGRSIGSKLVKYWINHEKEYAKRYTLWVRIDNNDALRMYEKIGFLPDGKIAPVMIKREGEHFA